MFKGGTCLKKCFFETYRFSEDLDFTVTDAAHLDREFLIARFKQIGEQVYDETGIEFPAELLRFDVYDNKRGGRACQGRVAYRGPMGQRGDPPRIKLDLTADEVLVKPSVMRPVAHAYSDAPADRIQARCYAYEEVFGEKVRALGERARPRDLYDVINLFRNEEFAVAAAAIRDVVQSKCNFKGIPFPSLVGLDPFKEELVGEWKNMLGHQLPALPSIESFLGALPEFFAWLGGQERAAPILAVHPMARNTEVIRGPAGTMGFAVRSPSFIETIRFAAANRMCIDLDYRDEQGRRSTRVIEPYSLRRTQAGDVLLMAVRADSAQARSYRLDRIEGARAMQRTFTPRYPVELTPTGPLSIPGRVPTQGSTSWGGFAGVRARTPRAARSGPTYVFRCTVCGKEFERKTYDATLRQHRGGGNCYGHVGIYVRTKY